MTRALWLLVSPALLVAADDPVARGAVVYRNSCAVTYCHGPEGKPGRAPGLASRELDAMTISRIAARGIPNTSMPAFGAQMKPDDLAAVAAYIVSLGAGSAAPSAKPAGPVPPEVREGRMLFFDAARTGACGTCHEVGGMGVPVSIVLQDLRTARTADLRGITASEIVTVRPSGEPPFPAVVVEKSPARVRIYDVSSRLPVLRTFRAADVSLTPGGSWKHSEAAALYTDAELAAISRYLQWAAEQQ